MNLTISALQYDIMWENPKENLLKLDKLILDVPNNSDVILLPEMFTTGFSMNTEEMAESMDGSTVNWMRGKAKTLNKVIAGSIIIEDDSKYRNRFLWVEPNGSIQYYDKRHSFGLGGEDEHFTNGNKRVVIKYKNWKIFPIICYDLRFPEWIKNNLDYDIIINVANWPVERSEHWKSFLNARAIENQAYVVGLNRIGIDEMDRNYIGDSAIINFDGNAMQRLGNIEGIMNAKFTKNPLDNYRSQFPFLKDQDSYHIDGLGNATS